MLRINVKNRKILDTSDGTGDFYSAPMTWRNQVSSSVEQTVASNQAAGYSPWHSTATDAKGSGAKSFSVQSGGAAAVKYASITAFKVSGVSASASDIDMEGMTDEDLTPAAVGSGSGSSEMSATGPIVAPVSTTTDTTTNPTTTVTPTASRSPVSALATTATPNKIALENLKQGNPESEWGVDGSGDGNIQGFATDISTNIGKTVDFKIATDSTHYRIDIYRMGYYGGDGARKVDSIDKTLTTAQIQPHPIVDMSIGLIDCGNWSVSASWKIPDDAVSGVYFAKLVREDGTDGESIIPFVVRDDTSTSDIVFQTSDTTWQAYNAWGGASLYFGSVPVDPADMIGYMPPNCSCGLTAIGRASAVSYNRPIITQTSPVGGTHDMVFGAELPAIEWLEQNGYDVSYISGVDSSRNGAQILNHDAFLSVGHDEYWSAEQRTAVETARDSGVNLAFWSGNEVYWKIRWETSIDGSGTPYRTMVCYKETYGTSTDPSGISTGTWRDPRYADPGQKPENALTGTMFSVDSYRSDSISIPYDYSNLRFWRDTDVANLAPGETYKLPEGILGYEWDSDVENGFRPAGLINMSLSSISVETFLKDYGTTIGSAIATHSLTMYRAESGALVFGAGTVFWSWGLSADHDGPAMPVDKNVQQSMVNMFADMGIQPTTLDASLVLATQSTDTVKPTSTISSTVGGSFIEGQRVTITGTAQDFGGGIIAGVEISTDSGAHWFKATGRENWSYNWVVQASGSYTIMSRAVDDSLNLETPTGGKQVTVALPSTSSLWTLSSKPAEETVMDRTSVELGVKFQSTVGGQVTGIRFYKGFYNGGSHSVSLWTANGTLLATGVSTGEPISGWQTVTFSTPIHITAGTTYVASYHTDGYYSNTDDYFGASYANGPLKAVDGGGVYAYGSSTNLFPGNSSEGANYWVDVVFDAGANTAPVAVDDSGFTSGPAGVTIDKNTLVANDTDANSDVLSIIAVSGAVHGTVALDSQTGNVIFTPTAGYTGAASFTYTVSDGRGGTDQGNVSLNVTAASTGASLFLPSEGPTTAGTSDNASLELGMKFVAASNGTITAIRFYKPAGATGTHTGSIWTAGGALLGTVTFSGESASGWQTATFTTPVQVSAGVTYVASYHTPSLYVATSNYFNTAHTNGPLTAPSTTTSGGNGVYAYGTSTLFPTASYSASNYWVDVVFNQSSPAANNAPTAVNDNGFVATYNTPLSIAASLVLVNDTDPDGDPLTITGVGGATHGTVQYDTANNAVIFTPTANYSGAASFTYTVSDGRNGTSTATVNLTVNPQSTTPTTSLFTSTDTPTVLSDADTAAVELGVKFVASAAGTITGIRYYKSAQDVGTHIGSLWTSTGTLLTSANFTNETASGWQTVTFAQPVTITAGTTYVASYQSRGHYASTTNYFTTSHTSGVLTAAGGANGVYAYGSGNEFPNATYNSTNYWVDVVYQPTSSQNTAPVAVNDSGFTTTAGTALTIQAASLLTNDTDADGDTLTVTGADTAVNGTVAFNSTTKAITFTPTAGYTGTAGFRYSISDGRGGTTTAQVSLNVNPNTAPVAVNDSGFTTTAGTALTIQAASLLANDTDANGDTLSITGANSGVNGTAVYNSATNSITFTPTAGYTGAASFQYAIADGKGGTATAQVSLSVNPAAPNTAPVAVNDSGFTTTTGSALTIQAASLLANDTDANGDILAITGADTALNGTVAYNSTTNAVTFTPTSGYIGAASFRYAISDGKGGTASALVSLNVNAASTPAQNLFAASSTPTTVSVNDNNPVNLGMKFQADVSGTITGLRFYKGATNTGTHTGYLWSSTGTLLASATFTGESASGWQAVNLQSSVAITANQTYVVSYSTNGNYSATSNGFASTINSGNLHAMSSALSGGNGVYSYGTAGLFPTNTYNSNNYYVDVAFKPQLAA